MQEAHEREAGHRPAVPAAAAPQKSPSPAEQLQALGDLIVALTESHSIGKIFFLIGRKLKSLLGPDVVQVWMLGEDGKELHQVLTQVDDEHQLAEVLAGHKIEELATSTFTSAETVRRRQVVIRRASDELPARVAEIMAAGKIDMTVSVPIVARDQIHGAINMMFRHAREFEAEDLRFLDALGRTVAAAIENAGLVDELQRERRWVETILNELPSGVVMVEGENARMTRANKAFERLMGRVEGLKLEAYPERFQMRDAATGEPMPWQDLALTKALRGESSAMEYETVGDDGVHRRLLVHGAPLYDPLRNEPAAIVSMQDVTGVRQLERQSRRQAQLLQFTFDNVPAGIAILDAAKSCLVEFNDKFARFFGDPRTLRPTLLGRVVPEIYPGFESAGLADIFRRVRDTRVPFSAPAYEFDGFPRGVTYWNVSLLPMEENGRVENLLLFAVEVTGLVEAQRRLRVALVEAETATTRVRAANRELVEAVRVKDEFLSTLSHELRTPLTPILGWTRILRSQGIDAGLLEQGLAVIERNVMAQVRLVDDLLDLSGLVYDHLTLNRERVELNAILREAWEEVHPDAEAKRIELFIRLAPEPLMLEGDRLRLRQVFANLLANAVKFSEEEGRVGVASRTADGRLEVEVVDEGIGIEADFVPRIFDRFQQADPSTTRRHGGLGIGLSISKKLIELHGGTIEVESAGPGRGSRFRVTLPAPAPPSSESPYEEDDPAVGLEDVVVLLADDEPDTVEAIRRLLELEGSQVVTAASGREAIQAALRERPDVVLCDLQMSDLDGYEVAARLRALPEMACVRQIALSGHGAPADLERARQAGFDAHLLKPVEPDRLFATMLEVLKRQPAER